MPRATGSSTGSGQTSPPRSDGKRKRQTDDPRDQGLPKKSQVIQGASKVHQDRALHSAGRQHYSNGNTHSEEIHAPTKPGQLRPSKMYNFEAGKSAQNRKVIDPTASNLSPLANTARKPLRNVRDSQQNGPRKILVKNFQSKPRIDPRVYVEQILEKADACLEAIYTNEPKRMPCSLEELYKGVENVCRMGSAAEVSKRLAVKQEHAITSRIAAGLSQVASTSEKAVLGSVLAAWKEWKTQSLIVLNVYMFLDRFYLLRQGKVQIQDSSVAMFRRYVFEDSQLRPILLEQTLKIISDDRENQPAEQAQCQQAVSMFYDLGVYTQCFEPKFLDQSQTFIKDYSEKAAAELGLSGYIVNALELMDKEVMRVSTYGLDSSTRKDLLALLENQLIHRQQNRLVQSGEVAELLDNNDIDMLGKLYGLLARLNLAEKLRVPFEKWIDTTGSRVVFDDQHQDDMITNLLALKQQLDNVWLIAFRRDTEIGHGLRKAFELFINKTKKSSATHGTDNSKVGEMIAKYVDLLLRGGSKAIPAVLSRAPTSRQVEEEEEDAAQDEEKEVDAQLEQVLDLFRFVHGKAVFEAFYKKDLARRLLLNRSASNAAELSMLSRLKTECGEGFTTNLNQMFKDIDLGREEMDAYQRLMEERGEKPSLDLTVSVLSSSAWPSYPDIPFNVPLNIKKEIERFERIYGQKHSGRKLSWKHALAHCQVRARFPRGVKELVMSGFQAVVLLLFNGLSAEEEVSYERILGETGLPENELKRTLQSLACAKIRPLRKYPQGREINNDDKFTWNAAFKHERQRVKINQVQLKETKEENKETHERVAEDRGFETQAAIVRIMKAKKTIAHNLLIAEVIDATRKRGVLSVQDIKRHIDRLIDKEYMEREAGNMYSYIA